jgi:hypothetical protein
MGISAAAAAHSGYTISNRVIMAWSSCTTYQYATVLHR